MRGEDEEWGGGGGRGKERIGGVRRWGSTWGEGREKGGRKKGKREPSRPGVRAPFARPAVASPT